MARASSPRIVLGIDADAITAFHDAFLARPGDAPSAEEVWRRIADNHRHNVACWGDEDRARRIGLPDALVAQCKRSIDRHGARRIEAIAAIDVCIQAKLAGLQPEPDVRLHSETAGAMIDRLSILALKINHMRLQTLREDAGAEHVARCRAALERLAQQRLDLAACLDRLLLEAGRGRACFATCGPFDLYGDPALEPKPYGDREAPARVGELEVLIPTGDRPAALAVTLTSLFAQSLRPARVIVSDRGETEAAAAPEVLAVLRLLRMRGIAAEVCRQPSRCGLGEQLRLLLAKARAPYVLCLDDDVVTEPDLFARLVTVMLDQRCGFVGSAAIGASSPGDERLNREAIEFWDGPVEPETVRPGTPQWARRHLHRGANLYQVQTRLGLDAASQRRYRVAWIAGCVLFDTARLRAAGGFEFGPALPGRRCRDDVLAQLRVLARDGGCGIVPSGAWRQVLPTAAPLRQDDAPPMVDTAAP